MMYSLSSVILSLLVTSTVAASPHHHHHHHGEAQLAAIQEGDLFILEFQADLMDLVGFEHRPETPEQKAALASLHVQYSDNLPPFDIPEDAKCTLASTRTHGGYKKHADENADKKHEESGYAEHLLTVQWKWNCEDRARLDRITTSLFGRHPAIQNISVIMLTDNGQSGATLTARNVSFKLP